MPFEAIPDGEKDLSEAFSLVERATAVARVLQEPVGEMAGMPYNAMAVPIQRPLHDRHWAISDDQADIVVLGVGLDDKSTSTQRQRWLETPIEDEPFNDIRLVVISEHDPATRHIEDPGSTASTAGSGQSEQQTMTINDNLGDR